jgi:hypothetical protein
LEVAGLAWDEELDLRDRKDVVRLKKVSSGIRVCRAVIRAA